MWCTVWSSNIRAIQPYMWETGMDFPPGRRRTATCTKSQSIKTLGLVPYVFYTEVHGLSVLGWIHSAWGMAWWVQRQNRVLATPFFVHWCQFISADRVRAGQMGQGRDGPVNPSWWTTVGIQIKVRQGFNQELGSPDVNAWFVLSIIHQFAFLDAF